MKRIVVFGGSGQLGRGLVKRFKALGELYAPSRQDLDFRNPESIKAFIEKDKPDLVINAAAMTDVDGCEEKKAEANQVNFLAVKAICEACSKDKARFVHISTDYVFNGKAVTPYEIDSIPSPINEYGDTKRRAEKAVLVFEDSLVIRTSWLYGSLGNNFLRTMLHLMKEKKAVRIVNDQIGSPTSVDSLADFIVKASITPRVGLYHWSDLGKASWFQFAVEIQKQALELGLLSTKVDLIPIKSKDYPCIAARPAYSVLSLNKSISDFDVKPVEWRSALSETLGQLKLEGT